MISLLLLLLPIYVLSAYASDYSDVCPSKDGTTETLADGYAYTYSCGKTGTLSSLYAVVKDIDIVGKCATACRDSPRCKGSAWNPTLHTCSLFGSGEQDPFPLLGTIFLRTKSQGDGPCKVVQDQLDQCTAGLETATSQNRQCTSDLDKCQDGAEACMSSLEDCKAESGGGQENQTLLSYYQSAVQACVGQPQVVDGYKYLVHCNKIPERSSVIIIITGDFTTCAKECNKNGDKCVGFAYHLGDSDQCFVLSLSEGLQDTYGIVITALRG